MTCWRARLARGTGGTGVGSRGCPAVVILTTSPSRRNRWSAFSPGSGLLASRRVISIRPPRWPRAAAAVSDDVPLAEDRELYQVGAGPLEAPLMQWKVDHPLLELDQAALSALCSQASGQPLWVRQIGTSGLSRATLLEILPQRHDEGTNP